MKTLSKEITESGVEIRTGIKIMGIDPEHSVVHLDGERLVYGHLFNCAGLHADSIAQKYGVGKQYRILPFKGLYWDLKISLLFALQLIYILCPI